MSFKQAMENAYSHLMQNHYIRSEEEEYEQFRDFYSILLRECGYDAICDSTIDLLAHDTVYNDERLLFFDDVANALENLNSMLLLGIVSDAWPSLERIYRNKGFRSYFSTFVISSRYGVCKSDKKLLEIALEELRVRPPEAVFVDDCTDNLFVAKELGIIPGKMDRYIEKSLCDGFVTVRTLTELLAILRIS